MAAILDFCIAQNKWEKTDLTQYSVANGSNVMARYACGGHFGFKKKWIFPSLYPTLFFGNYHSHTHQSQLKLVSYNFFHR